MARYLDTGKWFGVAAALVAGIVLGIAFLDRPIANWMFGTLHVHRAWFDALTHIVDPLLPGASLGLLAAAVAGLAGYHPGRAARIAITCCVAVILIVTLKDQSKYAFGRLWPETWVENNPSWIGTGSYGFYPFHGGRGWASFPSGHTAVITAPAMVVWRTVPRLRWVAALAVALVAIGLLGADYHFFSDILAGALLGGACGLGAEVLVSLDWGLRTDGQAPGRRQNPDSAAPSREGGHPGGAAR